MQFDINDAQIEYLRLALSEDLERNQEHIRWLASDEAEHEEDRDQQRAECERNIEQGQTPPRA
jgi:hypothetical protein